MQDSDLDRFYERQSKKILPDENLVPFKKGAVVQINGVVFRIQHVSPQKVVLKPLKKGMVKK